MRTIWKFPLQHEADTYLVPKGATPIHVAMQNDLICVWMTVDSKANRVERRISIHGTGNSLDHVGGRHIGSVLDGVYVWHVFDGGEKAE